MKTECEIIGAAVRRLLSSTPTAKISRRMLIEELSREYYELYESGKLAEDSLVYESALWRLINSTEHPYFTFLKTKFPH